MIQTEEKIESIPQLIEEVYTYINKSWTKDTLKTVRSTDGSPFPDDKIDSSVRMQWFRGQRNNDPLLPSVLRHESKLKEPDALISFMRKASVLGNTPPSDRPDLWLFLAQHNGLPTRLLDWTEGLLIATFFAVMKSRRDVKKSYSPIIWLINPAVFNWVSVKSSIIHGSEPTIGIHTEREGKTITDFDSQMKNFMGAFGRQDLCFDGPTAVFPAHIHHRIHVQKGRFTIHGKDPRPIEKYFEKTDLIQRGFMKSFRISVKHIKILRDQLRMCGITYSTLFPDFSGISRDIADYENDNGIFEGSQTNEYYSGCDTGVQAFPMTENIYEWDKKKKEE